MIGWWLAAALADEPAPEPPAPDERPEELVVVVIGHDHREPTGVALDHAAVVAFPASSADGLLRAVPGVHLSAHGGRGKAFQYFVRGFDAVHGSDLAVDVEGVPLNEPSNIHANGYLDVHLLPTALVRGLEAHLGSARAEVGGFAVAADASYRLGLEDEGVLVEVGGGTDKGGSALVAWRPRRWEPGTFLVAEATAGAGVGEQRGWRQVRGAAGIEGWAGATRWRAFVLGYDGAYESPGVLREDDLRAGRIGFWEAYDVPNHGHSSRVLAAADVLAAGPRIGGQALVYGQWRWFDLVQDFTGWYREPDHGDAIRQFETAWTGGVRVKGAWRPFRDPDLLALRGGIDARLDDADVGEQGVDADEIPWQERIDASFLQWGAGGWAEVAARPVRWLLIVPGLRAEGLGVHLTRRLDEDGAPTHDEATSTAPVLAPKGSITVGPDARVAWTTSAGRGFRPPQALGVADGDRAPFGTADTVETSLQVHPSAGVDLSFSAFATFVSNEIVFDHAAARFLATGSTRRLGGEVIFAWRPIEVLVVRADAGYTDGRYTDTGEALPYAPRVLASAGLYTDALTVGPTAWTAGLRGWFLGPRPIPGGFQSHSAFVMSATAHGEWSGWVLDLDVDNLLGLKWRDGEFAFPSWFDTDAPRSELSVRHVTAGDPFALRVAVGRRFR